MKSNGRWRVGGVVAVAIWSLVAACRRNPQWCGADRDCPADMPACDVVGTNSCVQCTSTNIGACAGTTPICGSDDACRACTDDSECESGVCNLDTGACFGPDQVLYVAMNGTGAACTHDAPCGSFGAALAAVGTTKTAILVGAGSYQEHVQVIDENLTIHAVGAKLAFAGSTSVFEVSGAADVSVMGLLIQDASGMSNTGAAMHVTGTAGNRPTVHLDRVSIVNHDGDGIDADDADLTVSQAVISGNFGMGISIGSGSLTLTRTVVRQNAGGAASLTASAFDLENDMIVENGNGTVPGGISIVQGATTGPHLIDFDTIANNIGPSTSTNGIACTNLTVALTFSSDILAGNAGTQIGGSGCSVIYSDVTPGGQSGTGNLASDPQFLDPAMNNFHLQATSPCKDAADPSLSIDTDYDGDVRPQGPASDIGADEVTP